MASTSCSLLCPWLLTAAAYFAAVLGVRDDVATNVVELDVRHVDRRQVHRRSNETPVARDAHSRDAFVLLRQIAITAVAQRDQIGSVAEREQIDKPRPSRPLDAHGKNAVIRSCDRPPRRRKRDARHVAVVRLVAANVPGQVLVRQPFKWLNTTRTRTMRGSVLDFVDAPERQRVPIMPNLVDGLDHSHVMRVVRQNKLPRTRKTRRPSSNATHRLSVARAHDLKPVAAPCQQNGLFRNELCTDADIRDPQIRGRVEVYAIVDAPQRSLGLFMSHAYTWLGLARTT